jgi:hypothetical protein
MIYLKVTSYFLAMICISEQAGLLHASVLIPTVVILNPEILISVEYKRNYVSLPTYIAHYQVSTTKSCMSFNIFLVLSKNHEII